MLRHVLTAGIWITLNLNYYQPYHPIRLNEYD